MIDQVGIHDHAAVSDRLGDHSVLHHGHLLAYGLPTRRPCGLPLGHLGRLGHEGRLRVEVLANVGPVAKGIGVLHQVGGANLHAHLAKDRVGREGEGLL